MRMYLDMSALGKNGFGFGRQSEPKLQHEGNLEMGEMGSKPRFLVHKWDKADGVKNSRHLLVQRSLK